MSDEEDDLNIPLFKKEDKKKFFSPTMDVGQLMTLGGIIASIVGGYYSFDARLTLIERQIGRQTQVIELSIRQDEQLKYLVERVGKIEEHVDTLSRHSMLVPIPGK